MAKALTRSTHAGTIASAGRSAPLSPRKTMERFLELDTDRARWADLQRAVRSTTLDEDSWRDPPRHLGEARRVVRGIGMTLADLEHAEESVRAINATACEDRQLELLLGVLIDAYPNANPPSIEGYLNGLFLSISRENTQTAALARPGRLVLVSAVAVAAAVARAWDLHKFPPSPSEMLDLCKASRDRFGQAVPALRRLQDVRAFAEEVLIAAGELAEYTDGSGEGPELKAAFDAAKATAVPDG